MHGSHAENAAPIGVSEVDPLKIRAVDVGDSIELRQPMIDEGIIALDQIEERAISAQQVIEKCGQLGSHRGVEFSVEFRIFFGIRPHLRAKAINVEPLQREPFAQCVSFGIR